jgi:chemotaxis protein methyltransferase CheR
MTPRNLQILSALLHQRSGIVIGPDKLYLVQTRLAGLLRSEGLANLDCLAERLALAPNGELARCTIEAMTTNETLFFRDDAAFAHLRDVSLPQLRQARQGTRLRIWSAAASTGQEAYSLAMLLAEARPPCTATSVEILATDIARGPLARAEAGLYSQFEVQRGITAARLAQHFVREADGWRVRPNLRSMVRCQNWNLLNDPAPLGRFDIVLCRNVLIYFDGPTRARVLARLGEALASDGFLYLGGSETLLERQDGFVPAPGGRGVFLRARTGASAPQPVAARAADAPTVAAGLRKAI